MNKNIRNLGRDKERMGKEGTLGGKQNKRENKKHGGRGGVKENIDNIRNIRQ